MKFPDIFYIYITYIFYIYFSLYITLTDIKDHQISFFKCEAIDEKLIRVVFSESLCRIYFNIFIVLFFSDFLIHKNVNADLQSNG